MQNYMLTVLVKNSVDEKKRTAFLDTVKQQFDTLKKEDLWGNRGLAYPIKHEDKAFYAHFEFAAEQNKIATIDRMVKLNEDILRYLLLKVETKKATKPKKIKATIKSSEKKDEAGTVEVKE
jgi:small subunit ribosomal protein S6